MSTSVALPGQLLGPASSYRPGPGVHLHDAQLYSSLLGAVTISHPSNPASASALSQAKGPAKRMTKITAHLPSAGAGSDLLPTISVARHAREVLPQVGNVVLCRVTRITPRQAGVAILVCGETVLEAEWQGVIRVQDVRATEKDRCRIYDSFRPGDIVRASVVRVFLFFFLVLFFFSLVYGDDADGVMMGRIDLSRRSEQLLPVHGEQRVWRHHGRQRSRKYHVPRVVEGVQGPGDGVERGEKGGKALLSWVLCGTSATILQFEDAEESSGYESTSVSKLGL